MFEEQVSHYQIIGYCFSSYLDLYKEMPKSTCPYTLKKKEHMSVYLKKKPECYSLFFEAFASCDCAYEYSIPR